MTRINRLVLCILLSASPNDLIKRRGSPWTNLIALASRNGRPLTTIPCIAALRAVNSPPLVNILSPDSRPTRADPFMPAHFINVICITPLWPRCRASTRSLTVIRWAPRRDTPLRTTWWLALTRALFGLCTLTFFCRCLRRAYTWARCGNTHRHRVSLIRAPVHVARVCPVNTLRTRPAWLRTPTPSIPLTPPNRSGDSLLLKTITLIGALSLLRLMTHLCTLPSPLLFMNACEPVYLNCRKNAPMIAVLVALVRNVSLLTHLCVPVLCRRGATSLMRTVPL